MVLCRKSAVWGALGGLCSTVLAWGSLHFLGKTETAHSKFADSLYSNTEQALFAYRGQTINASQLPSELKNKFGSIIDSYEVMLNSKLLKLNYLPF